MGIGKTKITEDGIVRYYNIVDDKQVFVANGMGCDTVFYKSVPEARALINHLGRIPNGRDANLCKVCQNHYSPTEAGYKLFPPMACKDYKNGLSTLGELILEKSPKSGKILITDKEAAKALRRESKKKVK